MKIVIGIDLFAIILDTFWTWFYFYISYQKYTSGNKHI